MGAGASAPHINYSVQLDWKIIEVTPEGQFRDIQNTIFIKTMGTSQYTFGTRANLFDAGAAKEAFAEFRSANEICMLQTNNALVEITRFEFEFEFMENRWPDGSLGNFIRNNNERIWAYIKALGTTGKQDEILEKVQALGIYSDYKSCRHFFRRENAEDLRRIQFKGPDLFFRGNGTRRDLYLGQELLCRIYQALQYATSGILPAVKIHGRFILVSKNMPYLEDGNANIKSDMVSKIAKIYKYGQVVKLVQRQYNYVVHHIDHGFVDNDFEGIYPSVSGSTDWYHTGRSEDFPYKSNVNNVFVIDCRQLSLAELSQLPSMLHAAMSTEEWAALE
jgi:hypothetical protein